MAGRLDKVAAQQDEEDGERDERDEGVRCGAAHDAKDDDYKHGNAEKVDQGHGQQLVHEALILGEAVQDAAVRVVHEELRRHAHDR